jgi:hypothetical protein
MILGIIWLTFMILMADFPFAKMRWSPNKASDLNYTPILTTISLIGICVLYNFRKKNYESVKPIKKRFEKK